MSRRVKCERPQLHIIPDFWSESSLLFVVAALKGITKRYQLMIIQRDPSNCIPLVVAGQHFQRGISRIALFQKELTFLQLLNDCACVRVVGQIGRMYRQRNI